MHSTTTNLTTEPVDILFPDKSPPKAVNFLCPFPYPAECSCLMSDNSREHSTARTDWTLIRAEEGPKVLASPPRAKMAQTNFLFAVVDNTLDG